MPPSTAPVALSRSAGALGGAASLGEATYVAVTDASYRGTELLVIRRAGDRGERIATLPFDQVTGMVACGASLLVTGGLPDGPAGAVLVAADGRIIRQHRLNPDASFPAPVCRDGAAMVLWRSRAAPTRLRSTSLGAGDGDDVERDLFEQPEMIDHAIASAGGRLLLLSRSRGGLRTQAVDAAPRGLSERAADALALCGTSDGFLAFWTEDHARTIRGHRLALDGAPEGAPIEIARTAPGEEVRSVQVTCRTNGRFAVLWQTRTHLTDPLPGDRATPRLWVAFGDARGVRTPVELPDGGPAIATWRGDELVVVHGTKRQVITTLTSQRDR